MLVLFIGDDWAEDHHDVELQDETGRRLATARLPDGLTPYAMGCLICYRRLTK
ncbi:hypothetical protein AB0N09_41815 [Streptomyces erythrochromogenes]|uniref:hypothetical protein n=1 Tax=Streptomyces erythrochromogenes TaxID=285574 RepID=UPI0034476B70